MARFEIIDADTLNKIEGWADKLVKRIQVEMQNQGLNASGNLSNSLEYSVADNHIRVLANPYMLYAEKGRDKGKIPYNFSTILETWIADKHLTVPAQYKTPNQFAWAIAMKIKKYGSDKYRNPSKRQDVLEKPMSELLPDLNDILQNRVVLYINDNLF